MAEQLSIDLEALRTEYSMLEEQIKTLDTLYEETKSMIEDNKKSNKRNYVFLASQTASLNSIITSKTSIISKMNEIRFKAADMEIKQFNTNKNIETEGNSMSGMTKDLFNMLLNTGRDTIARNEETTESNKEENESKEKDSIETLGQLDDVLDNLDEEKDISELEPEDLFNRISSLKDKYQLEIVVDSETNEFLFISTAEADNGSILEKSYTDKLTELNEILENISLLDENEDNTEISSNLGINFELVKIS